MRRINDLGNVRNVILDLEIHKWISQSNWDSNLFNAEEYLKPAGRVPTGSDLDSSRSSVAIDLSERRPCVGLVRGVRSESKM